MSEPKRWSEDYAPRDIELLMRAARAEEPSEASLRRSLSAVGAGLATLGVAASAGATGTAASGASTATGLLPVTAGLVAKWVAFGATLGTLVVGTTTIAPRAWEKVQGRAPAAKAPRAGGFASPPAANPAQKARAANSGSTASAAAPSRPLQSPSGSRTTAPVTSIPNDETLIEEVRSVDRARAALAAGRPGDALARLDEYERAFAEQRFAPEALYLRLEALASLGRTDLARKTAERLLTRYPNSPQGERARAMLAKNP